MIKLYSIFATVAQPVEQLIRNQQVTSSNLVSSSIKTEVKVFLNLCFLHGNVYIRALHPAD